MQFVYFTNGTDKVFIKSYKLADMITGAKKLGIKLEFEVVDVVSDIPSIKSEVEIATKVVELIARRPRNTMTMRAIGNYLRAFKPLSKDQKQSILNDLIHEKKISVTESPQALFYNIYIEGENTPKIGTEFDWMLTIKLNGEKFIPFEKVKTNYYRKLMAKAKSYGVKFKCSNTNGGMKAIRVF